ncbi:hypothetical protein BDW22DRAFT_1484877 [Trametopsis cervina]|nr:hypothetical protein BDW22DRAFT_1484877 [Trametopsis cervina]
MLSYPLRQALVIEKLLSPFWRSGLIVSTQLASYAHRRVVRPLHSFHPGFFISATITAVACATVVVSSWAAADFEQALRGEGTVVIKESLDVDTLGVLDTSNTSISSLSPFSSPASAPRTPHTGFQPATPTIVPPTPSPGGRPPTSSSLSPPRSSTSSSSGREVFYDAQEDSDLQTKRRSMYRSAGTASSPDLATLLRKSKNKEAASRERSRDGRTVVAPGSTSQLTPNRLVPVSKSGRQRPSTGSSQPANVTPSRNKLRPPPMPSPNMSGVATPDWVLTSPRSMGSMRDASGAAKSGMFSMRAKTSAFLGKMLGTGTTRERSRTVTSVSSPTSPTYFEAPPPVPPLPDLPRRVSSQTIDDVFSTPASTPDFQKPLPQIQHDDSDTEIEDFDDRSMVVVQPRARTPSPTSTVTHHDPGGTIVPKRNKRRSMSVSDVDLKRVMAASSSATPMPRPAGHSSKEGSGSGSDWNRSLSGIITDFKGELMQLELNPISTSLDLKDPSTPARKRPISNRAHSEEHPSPDRPSTKHAASLPLPTVYTSSVESSPAQRERDETGHESPLRSPQISQIPRPPVLRYGPRSPGARNTLMASPVRDNNRLQVHHRSSASSSEPSLIPVRDGRTFSGLSTGSQHDLSANDLLLTRFSPARLPSKSEEPGDLLARGKELAKRCWDEDEDFMAKDKFAEWLGGQSPINKVALRHYVEFFDFTGLRLDNAFRKLCAKLYLKAETQQVDRILEQFARRYWDCNPTSIFGSANVVHAVAYSLLLLNTDLHVAELTSRMSRGQFVRNTIAAIQMQVQPGSTSDLIGDDWSSIRGGGAGSDVSDPSANMRTIKRSDSMTSWSSVTREAFASGLKVPSSGQLTTGSTDTSGNTQPQTPVNDSALSVVSREPKSSESSVAPMVYDRNWEAEMEVMLKEIYSSVKSQQILQPIGSIALARSSTSSLSPHGTLLRNRSLRTASQDRLNNFKRGSIRGIQSILTPQLGYNPYGSSTDGRASPAPSFATSHEGINASTAAFLTPALGFASNLSHTIIREAQEDDARSVHSDNSISTDVSITDEELALLGPPWAKEGILCRKQYWESTGKRAKSKDWKDVFVVIQKGELSMFTFGEHSGGGGAVVGGGNWLENASPVGTVLLAHSLSHALPPPGYNRQRPHCMVLTLANGGVYFFQAGTEELVNEWVSTCNYWAARQSKEPLQGGVSNMEYGWNRVLDPVTRNRSTSEDSYGVDKSDSVSIRSERSSRSRFRGKEFASTMRAEKSPWQDRILINDWKPPMPPTVPSNHDEETQMEALQKHVAALKHDLIEHNELRTPMTKLYVPRSSNAAKATANWEKRSQYILTEIIKYELYIDSLQAAMSLRLKKRGEKTLERALGGAAEHAGSSRAGKWKGPDEETIEESEEPPPTAKLDPSPSRMKFHRREHAED